MLGKNTAAGGLNDEHPVEFDKGFFGKRMELFSKLPDPTQPFPLLLTNPYSQSVTQSVNRGFILPPFLVVLSLLDQKLVHLLEMHVLHPLRVVLLLQFPELLGLGQELLVEVQKRAFEEPILLVLGQIECCFVLQFLLLEDVSAVILLLIQDLDGQVSIVVQFLQQPSHLVPI